MEIEKLQSFDRDIHSLVFFQSCLLNVPVIMISGGNFRVAGTREILEFGVSIRGVLQKLNGGGAMELQ